MFGRSKSESTMTIISEGTTLNGKLETSSDLELYGSVKVSTLDGVAIDAKSKVHIAESAEVIGDIHAGDVIVEGKVIGNIISNGQVKLAKGSTLTGDVTSRSLLIEDGVEFTGAVKVAKTTTYTAE